MLQISALESGVRLFRTVASMRAFFVMNDRKTLVQLLVAHIERGEEVFHKGEVIVPVLCQSMED